MPETVLMSQDDIRRAVVRMAPGRPLYAFLAGKERRSGCRRTVEGYSRMLQHFFGGLRKVPMASGKGFLFSDRGDTTLRGLEEPVRLYEVRWREDS